MLDITPDWTMIKTARGAEEEFTGFKWTGPGWYVDKTGQTLLAVPMADLQWPPPEVRDSPWRQSGWPEDQNFVFLSWSAPPFDAFNAVVNAPTRQDDRPLFAGETPKDPAFGTPRTVRLELLRSALSLGKNVLGLPCFCDTPELHSEVCVAARELTLKLRTSHG